LSYKYIRMVRIVIQDSRSLRYLSESGTWDYEPKTARHFGRITEAAEHCQNARLKEVHIVIGVVQPDGRFDSSSKTIMRLPRLRPGTGTRLDEDTHAPGS
jgi:hypothetical protein